MENKKTLANSFAVFANLKVLICCAIFVAISIVLGKYIPLVNIDVLRFSLENLSIVLTGILFGPVAGAIVGCMADLLGCVLVGYTVNPIVTLGAASIGFASGIMSYYVVTKPLWLKVLLCELTAHVIGSVIIKTFGLALYYDMPLWQLMLWRLLNYGIIAAIEFVIIFPVLRSRGVQKEVAKILSVRRR